MITLGGADGNRLKNILMYSANRSPEKLAMPCEYSQFSDVIFVNAFKYHYNFVVA